MRRWLRTTVAIFALALVGCAHPSPAPPQLLAAPAPGACMPSLLKQLTAAIPGCASVPAGVLDAARIKEAPLGSRVSVRGFLVLGDMECTLKACLIVHPDGGEEPTPCCNSCGAPWRLAGLDEASASSSASRTTEIFLRRAGDKDRLGAGAIDCVMRAMAASPREEIIASGRLATGATENDPGSSGADTLVIDDVTLCATGRWTPAPAKPEGDLPGCR